MEEKDIENLPYQNVVVKENLRRHMTQECKLRVCDIPYKGNVEFYTSWMLFIPHIWLDPMTFNPQRFLDLENEVDITGKKQVKMMPFGVGRSICPTLSLGTLHINLILA
jgi:cytochrome P450